MQHSKTKSLFLSKLYLCLGYHQVPLDEESKDLTTFIMVHGKYRFERAPFGICSIAEVFNRKLEEHLQTYRHEGECWAVDDCLLFEGTFEEHVEHVCDFLSRCAPANITIAPNKFKFAEPELVFAGYHVSEQGHRPGHELVGPLQNFTSPKTVTDLRAFFRLGQQFGEAAPRLAEVTEQFHLLLQKGGKNFRWGDDQERAFQETKRHLSNVRLLEFFDYKLPTRMVSDASRVGFGYVLQKRQELLEFCRRRGWWV